MSNPSLKWWTCLESWITGLWLAIIVATAMLTVSSEARSEEKRRPLYQIDSLPSAIESVPPHWRGHDMLRLALHAASVKPRGEFETTEAYEARQRRTIEAYAYGRVRLTDRIAVSGPLFKSGTFSGWPGYSYDPDTEVFQVCVSTRPYEHYRKEDKLGIYTGHNAFGVTKTITRRRISSLLIAFESPSQDTQCFVPVTMSGEDAERNTRTASWALLGTLVQPYVSIVERSSSPSISHPFADEVTEASMTLRVDEVIAFDSGSGRIFYRRGWDTPITPAEAALERCDSERGDIAAACKRQVTDCSNWYASNPNALRQCLAVPIRPRSNQ